MQIKKSTLMWIIIGILMVFVLYLTFRNGGSVNVNDVGAATSSVKSAVSAASSGGMVGGC